LFTVKPAVRTSLNPSSDAVYVGAEKGGERGGELLIEGGKGKKSEKPGRVRKKFPQREPALKKRDSRAQGPREEGGVSQERKMVFRRTLI